MRNSGWFLEQGVFGNFLGQKRRVYLLLWYNGRYIERKGKIRMSEAKKHTIKVERAEEEMRKFLVKCMLNNKEPEDVIKEFMWG